MRSWQAPQCHLLISITDKLEFIQIYNQFSFLLLHTHLCQCSTPLYLILQSLPPTLLWLVAKNTSTLSCVWVFTHFHPFSSSLSLSLSLFLTLLPYSLHLSVHLFLSLFLPLAEACTHSTSLLQPYFLSLWHHLVAVSKLLDELHHVCSKFFKKTNKKNALRISSPTKETGFLFYPS